MIFDGKPIDEITDDEIVRIVREHIGERQHLELKATVNLASDEDRRELLLDMLFRLALSSSIPGSVSHAGVMG